MCGRRRSSGNAESIALQRESLDLSREQFAESKRQWGEQFQWQKDKAAEQKKIAEARAGKGPTRTTEYAMSALEGRSQLGFGKDKLKTGVTGGGLAIV
tara:strand:+ start:192 stop:485 length:294 start_codon:yes stop_codon:yes gene_type:complete